MTQPARIQRVPLQQESSREAFRMKEGGRPFRILAYLKQHGGATDYELEQALGESHQAVSVFS